MAAMRFSSVKVTGLVPWASRLRVASNDVSAAHVSSHVGVASALAGMMPLRRTRYPPTRARTMAVKMPNTNALIITLPPSHQNPATAESSVAGHNVGELSEHAIICEAILTNQSALRCSDSKPYGLAVSVSLIPFQQDSKRLNLWRHCAATGSPPPASSTGRSTARVVAL